MVTTSANVPVANGVVTAESTKMEENGSVVPQVVKPVKIKISKSLISVSTA